MGLPQRTTNTGIRHNQAAGSGDPLPSGGRTVFKGGKHVTFPKSTFNNVAGNYTEANIYQGNLPLERFEKLLHGIDVVSKHQEVKNAIGDNKQAGRRLLKHPTYVSWKAGQSKSRLLWLSGAPGSGKTVLCSRVIESIEGTKDPQTAMIFSYCLPGCNPNDVLASLLRQLLPIASVDSPEFSSMVKQCQFLHSVDEIPLTRLITMLSRKFKKVFIIVDALDACNNPVHVLSELTKLTKWAHVFVTSHPDIRQEFGKCEKITISPDDIVSDVRAFAEAKAKNIKTRDPTVRHSIVKAIVSTAQGAFVWVTSKCKRLAQAWSDMAILQSLDTVPPDMNETFIRSLERIDANPHRHLLRSALHLVTCAQWPITYNALAEAIGVLEMGSVWDPSRILSVPGFLIHHSENLLNSVPVADKPGYNDCWASPGLDGDSWEDNISNDDEIVIPFLLANPQTLPKSLASYALHPPSLVHKALAELSLSYLNLLLKHVNHIAGLRPSDYPFAEYALLSWTGHIGESGKPMAEYEQFFTAWRSTKAKATWIPDPVHMAVRLNLPVYRGISAPMFLAKDDEGMAPLHYAMKNSAPLDVIDWLLKKADPNQVSGDRLSATPLHLACLYHREIKKVIQRLLAAGADVKAQTKDGRTALHFLLEWQSPERVAACIDLLLMHGADVNAKDSHLRTPLHAFIPRVKQSESVEFIVDSLVKQGAEVDVRDKDGRTPLHAAIQSSYSPLVTSLLRNGANANSMDNSGDPPLAVAIGIDAEDAPSQAHILRSLFHHGDDVNYARADTGSTLLHHAARRGQVSVARFLLDNGAIVDAVDNESNTPLHQLCRREYTADELKTYQRLVGEILSHGANVHLRNREGRTPLDLAAQSGSASFVELLLERGARVNAGGESDETALREALSKVRPERLEDYRRIVKQLLKHGANINARGESGSTLLHEAASSGCALSLSLLVEEGAAIDARDDLERTALHAVCLSTTRKLSSANHDYESAVRILLDYGADIAARDKAGETPLHHAAMANESLVSYLLERSAEVNARDRRRKTPLHKAAQWGRPSVISLLIDKGAAATDEAGRHETPLHVLCKGVNAEYNQRQSKDYQDAASQLLRHGANLHSRNGHGDTPLVIASGNGQAAMVELLLKAGAAADMASVGRAVVEAVYWGAKKEDERDQYNHIIEKLLEQGIDVNSAYNAVGSPLVVANSMGYTHAVKLMRKQA